MVRAEEDEKIPAYIDDASTDDTPLMKSQEPTNTTLFCYRNVIILSISFFCLFTAYSATQNLESSIQTGNLGSISLTVLYLVNTFLVLISPVLVDYLTPHYALPIGMITYSVFILCNIPKLCDYYTLVPASALLGFGASFMWPAQGVYMTLNARYYSETHNQPQAATLGLFNGIFWGLFQLTQVVGNLISGFILNSNSGNTQSILFYVFLGFSVVGNVICLFIKKVPVSTGPVGKSSDSSTLLLASEPTRKPFMVNLTSTVRLFITTKMLLLVPYMFYVGLEQTYLFGDFTSQIIKPTLGQENIGYVMATFGAVDALCSFSLGKLSDKIGRTGLILFGLSLHGILTIFMFFCQSMILPHVLLTNETNSNDEPVQVINHWAWVVCIPVASLWGIGDAIGNTVLSALIGSVFMEDAEAGFSNMKFVQCIAFTLGFAFTSLSLSFMAETIIMIATIVISIVCFITLCILFPNAGINRARTSL